MMSRREAVLLVLTLLVVIIGGTFWFGLPLLEEYRELRTKRGGYQDRIQLADRLLKQREEIRTRLHKLQETMPEYAVDTDVTSQLLKNLQRTADQHGLILVRQEPEPEKQAGDLSEMTIGCTWEGYLDGLTHFLYALQGQGAMVDVRQLSINPASGRDARLKGTFKVDYAFSRFVPLESSGPDSGP